MSKKLVIFVSLLISISFVTAACSLIGGSGLGGGVPGSGNVQTETRDVGAFGAVSIKYPGAESIIQQGDKETVEIEADDNLLPQLSTEVVSGRLTINNMETDWKSTVNPSKPVKIRVTVKDLNEIELSAPVGTLELNELQADRLKLVLSGGAQIKINGIQVNMLDTDLSGAGDILASGDANEINLILSGLGNFDAANLNSNKATIELSGMGSATVRVEEDLTATLTGAGSIQYYGHPHVKQNVTGAGSIKPAE